MEPVERRRAVRAVVLDADDRVLLLHCRRPADGSLLWAPPGGGVEPGESEVAAVQRELAEEIGLHDTDVGPCLWVHEYEFLWREPVLQRDVLYLVRVDRHDVAPTVDMAEEGLVGVRWWTAAELAVTNDELVPSSLPRVLPDVIAGSIPPTPIELEP